MESYKTKYNQEKVGRELASKYGQTYRQFSPPQSQNEPQSPECKHGPKYDNDTPNNWLRGGPNESAEGKPNFDRTKDGR